MFIEQQRRRDDNSLLYNRSIPADRYIVILNPVEAPGSSDGGTMQDDNSQVHCHLESRGGSWIGDGGMTIAQS